MMQLELSNCRKENFPNLSLLYYKSKINNRDNEGKINFIRNFKEFPANNKRIQQRLESLQDFADSCISMQLVSRMICGIGYTNIMEWGFSFDWTTGVPWLPGSSFKGTLLSYIEFLIGKPVEKLDDKMKEPVPLLMYPDVKWTYKDIINVFGPQGENIPQSKRDTGDIVFMDVFPNNFSNYDIDVIAPHNRKYYSDPDKNLPDDKDDPLPLHFIVVPPDTLFKFMYRFRNDCKFSDEKKKEIIEKVDALIVETGQNYGFGAKTSSGYGFFIKK